MSLLKRTIQSLNVVHDNPDVYRKRRADRNPRAGRRRKG